MKRVLIATPLVLIALLLFVGGLFVFSQEEKRLDFNADGRDDPNLIMNDKAFVFLNTDNGFIPALYLLHDSAWGLVSQNEEFLILEEEDQTHPVRFNKVSRSYWEGGLTASGEVEDSQGNRFQVGLKLKKEALLTEPFFVVFLTIKNQGPADSPELRFSTNFSLPMEAEKAYFFSPGIFYGDNNPAPWVAEEMAIYSINELKKYGFLTFLANRPMLPLIAAWQDNQMVMMVTEESSMIGKKAVRNSLGWRMRENRPTLATWTHGYLFRRYAGPKDWEMIDANTTSKSGFSKGEKLTKKFYLAFTQGDLESTFAYYRLFREYFRHGLTQTVYEDMVSSLETKKKSLSDFYDVEKGFFSQVAGNKESVVNAWVGGAPAGYGLLRLGEFLDNEKLKQESIDFLDFLCRDSLAPSGFSYPYYSQGRWSTNGWWVGPYLQGIPARMATEGTFYLLKAYDHELENGVDHQSWLKVALSNLEAALAVWKKSNDFGYSYRESKPQLERNGSSAGILWVDALSLGYQFTGKEEYLQVAEEAADFYAQRFLKKGLLYGCELDQGFSPDASCAAHAFTAYVVLYEATRKPLYLEYAKKAADIYSTFIFSYNLSFAPDSWAAKKSWTSLGMSTSGARNNHLTFGGWPGFTYYLVKLYDLTKDEYYLHLAVDQYRASLEGYCQKEGEFYGVPGMGEVKVGYGFDWILHSDWGGERVWFGGIMHAGMLHQIYLTGANWPDTVRDFGELEALKL